MPLHDEELRVLLVDDEPTVLEVLRVTLEASGMQCSVAGNGSEALTLLRHLVPDVILSDLRMPKMSGFELLPIVRRLYPQVGIVVLSAESLSNAQQSSLPMHAHLQKGHYTLDQLVATIRAVASTLKLQRRFPPQGLMIDYSSDEQA